ncbi:MAG: DapH/DapD/GlmU-related protein, partial [Clostridiales bacterium]|nr:DapH/DapD/GlmU-related protein [Clostridiales bacterium]
NMKCKEDGTIYDDEYGKPISIGSNCWIASNVVIAAGVNIGEGCVIGAGSVVTRDIPDNSLAVGNPCRVIRQITEKDSIQNREELF